MVRGALGAILDRSQGQAQRDHRDYHDGLAIAPAHYTVADAVKYWLQHATTVKMYTTFADKHVIPARWVRASCVTCRWRTLTGG
ncbi:hypothetical protein ABZU75_35810 [Streptosporangium sp. NPDC005286]|uniref:hypothetical protein n=1 Tax=Streptosporangium sp. NPDC005286 TaxID=3154463 RepID=UPI0033B7DFC6